MSHLDDHDGEMNQNRALDEREIEAILGGHAAQRPDLEPLTRFVQAVRADICGPPPTPNAALAAVLVEGLADGLVVDRSGRAPVVAVAARRHRAAASEWRRNACYQAAARAVTRAAGLGLAMKMGTVTFVAAAGVTGAGAVGVLPGPVQTAVADSVETVTPFSIPRPSEPKAPGSNGIGDEVREKARQHGQDGTGPGIGKDRNEPGAGPGGNGEDRPQGKPDAPGAGGLDRANSGPGGPHAPDQVPAGKHATKPGKGAGSDGTPGVGNGRTKDKSADRDAGAGVHDAESGRW